MAAFVSGGESLLTQHCLSSVSSLEVCGFARASATISDGDSTQLAGHPNILITVLAGTFCNAVEEQYVPGGILFSGFLHCAPVDFYHEIHVHFVSLFTHQFFYKSV